MVGNQPVETSRSRCMQNVNDRGDGVKYTDEYTREVRRAAPKASWVGWLAKLPSIVWTGIYLFTLYQVLVFAINVPYMDEWEEFPRPPVLPWLFAQHNQHRIVTTKLLRFSPDSAGEKGCFAEQSKR